MKLEHKKIGMFFASLAKGWGGLAQDVRQRQSPQPRHSDLLGSLGTSA